MIRLLTLLFLFSALSPAGAQAQQVSAGNFDALNKLSAADECRTRASIINAELIEMEQVVSTILDCNAQGRVYDENIPGCVAVGQQTPEHTFSSNGGDGATLSFKMPNGNDGPAAVVGGSAGLDISCDGDTPTDPDTPDEGTGSGGTWVEVDSVVDPTVGCGEVAWAVDCYGNPRPSNPCTVGAEYSYCRNLIGLFKCKKTTYQCQSGSSNNRVVPSCAQFTATETQCIQ